MEKHKEGCGQEEEKTDPAYPWMYLGKWTSEKTHPPAENSRNQPMPASGHTN